MLKINKKLSKREYETLNAVYWQSYNNGYIDLNRIADNMKVKVSTVRSYLVSIYMKLGVNDLASAIIKARDVLEII